MAAWAGLAREFVGSGGVLLLGACREEDYKSELVVGPTVMVDPKLDGDLARAIAEGIEASGVQTTLDVQEAFDHSDGLLMEFISMLLTGKRLRQVIGEQIAARLSPGRAVERDVIRLVSTAHAAGIRVEAETLQRLVRGEDLTPALDIANRELLLLTEDGDAWVGLHELRSQIARDVLHSLPPPTLSATLQRLATSLPFSDAGRLVEFYARHGADLTSSADAIAERLRGSDPLSPPDGIALVESMQMADALRHSAACLSVLDQMRPAELDPRVALFFAYSHRFGGVRLDTHGIEAFRSLVAIADRLPEPPESLAARAVSHIPSERAMGTLRQASAEEAASWIEALEGLAGRESFNAEQLWASMGSASIRWRARVAASILAWSRSNGINADAGWLGPLTDRLKLLANELDDCVALEVRDEGGDKVVAARLLTPEDDSRLHDRSVETCRIVLDLIPEADVSDVVVVAPGGERFTVGDFADWHKHIRREKLPRISRANSNARFHRATRTLLAATNWTEPIRMLVDASQQLGTLTEQSLAWLLNPNHSRAMRQEAADQAARTIRRLVGSPGLPQPAETDVISDLATDSLAAALQLFKDLAVQDEDSRRDLQVATRCRTVAQQILQASDRSLPLLSSGMEPLPGGLSNGLLLIANLLFIRADLGRLPSVRRARAETWHQCATRIVAAETLRAEARERRVFTGTLGLVGDRWSLEKCPHVDLKSVQFLTNRWAVIFPADTEEEVGEFIRGILTEPTADSLAFRTFLLWESSGQLLPTHAMKLGIGHWWPVEADEIQEVAASTNMSILSSAAYEAWTNFVSTLVLASRSAGMGRLRHKAGLDQDPAKFESALRQAQESMRGLPDALAREASALIGAVRDEPSSDQPMLAEELYAAVTSNDVSRRVETMNQLSLKALFL
ncbi:MAG: hypothetical protein IT300_03850 [Dehalococcoidia bacterium]|nr:hypothetical protein [Dehalococcoidia bacterium]